MCCRTFTHAGKILTCINLKEKGERKQRIDGATPATGVPEVRGGKNTNGCLKAWHHLH